MLSVSIGLELTDGMNNGGQLWGDEHTICTLADVSPLDSTVFIVPSAIGVHLSTVLIALPVIRLVGPPIPMTEDRYTNTKKNKGI